MTFSFGHSEQERIEVEAHGYERAPVGEYYDDNWLTVEIRVRAGGFRGKASATIITSELTKFLSELRPLHQSLSGAVEFTTMEGQLSLRVVGDGKGHIELRGEVADQPASATVCISLCSSTSHSWEHLFVSLSELHYSFQNVWPNHALQRTRRECRGCNRCVPRAGSLSLGR